MDGHSRFGYVIILTLARCVQTPLFATTTLLTPVADTYISEGSADNPHGTNAIVITNLGATTANKRWSYLKFDLTGFDVANLKEARLNLWNTGAGGAGSAGLAFNIYGLLNIADTWKENTLTWNDDPNRAAGLKTLIKANTYGEVELANYVSTAGATASVENIFDVTNGAVLDFIKNSPDFSKITFVIYQDVNSSASGDAWASREDITVSHRPTLTLSTSFAQTPANTNLMQIIKVYLQGGQSNSDGRALTNGLPADLLVPQNDVPLYYYLTGGAANSDGTFGKLTALQFGYSALGGGRTFGPELTFGRTLADYFAISNQVSTNTLRIAIIKYAHGGTSLATDWAANGNATTNGEGADYIIFQKVVNAGLAKLADVYPGSKLELDGMIWVQGETDIDNGAATSAAYGTNLIRFINDIRLTYATNHPYGTSLPFFLSRISTNQTYYSAATDPTHANYLLVRAGQNVAAVTLSNVFMLNIDGPQFTTFTPYSSPGLHFDTEGQQALGSAFGQAVIDALPQPSLAVLMKSTNGWDFTLSGISGTANAIERAPSVTGPWTMLTNFVLGVDGATNFCDTTSPAVAGFYRARRP